RRPDVDGNGVGVLAGSNLQFVIRHLLARTICQLLMGQKRVEGTFDRHPGEARGIGRCSCCGNLHEWLGWTEVHESPDAVSINCITWTSTLLPRATPTPTPVRP